MIIKGGVGITTLKGGQAVKQSLSAANSTVNKGVYDATLLETVDADLAVGNIKSAVNIFGVAGAATVQNISAANAAVTDVLAPKTFFSVTGAIKTGTNPGTTDTLSKYYDANLAAAASYTPAVAGYFAASTAGGLALFCKLYSTVLGAWLLGRYDQNGGKCAFSFGDGSNLLFTNSSAGAYEICVLREVLSAYSYVRIDVALVSTDTYVLPVGLFSYASSSGVNINFENNLTTAGWRTNLALGNATSEGGGPTTISDGVNTRIHNNGGTNEQVVLIRAYKP